MLKMFNQMIITLLRLLGRSRVIYPKSLLDDRREAFKAQIRDINKKS